MKKAFNQLQKIKERLRNKYDTMQEYFDERSDSWYEGDKAKRI